MTITYESDWISAGSPLLDVDLMANPVGVVDPEGDLCGDSIKATVTMTVTE